MPPVSIEHNFSFHLLKVFHFSGEIQESILTSTCAALNGVTCFRSVLCVCEK